MTQFTVTQLVAIGGSIWEKGDLRRVYFNYHELSRFYGLMYDGWKYTVDGEKVSNNTGSAFASALGRGKLWYDLAAGEFCSKDLSDKIAQKLVERITKTLAQEDVAAETTKAATSAVDTPVSVPAGHDIATAAGPGIQGREVRSNRKPGRCRRCGGWVLAGEGYLYHIDPDEAYDVSGWVVEHKDPAICRAEKARADALLAEQAKAYTRD